MSTLNSGDMSIERSSTRIKAPPGGQSSICIGDGAPEEHNTRRSNSRPTSSSDFYGHGEGSQSNITSQQASNRRPHQQQPGNDIFGTGNVSGTPDECPPRRGGTQPPKQTFDVFNSNSVRAPPQNSGTRRPLSGSEQLDIFGREAVPVQTPGRRPIQQPNSNIFKNSAGQNEIDYRSHSASSQQQCAEDDSDPHVAAGTRSLNSNQSSSTIFNLPNQQSHVEVQSHRRAGPLSGQARAGGVDVMGHRQDEYREATNYQSASHQEYQPQHQPQHQQREGNGGGRSMNTTQSLGSVLSGGGSGSGSGSGGGGSQLYQGHGQGQGQHSSSRPNTGNSSQMGMLMGDQSNATSGRSGGRKASSAGQSSLVLN